MWRFFLYCALALGGYWCGAVVLDLHWYLSAVAALSLAGALVLAGVSASTSRRRAARIRAALPSRVTCEEVAVMLSKLGPGHDGSSDDAASQFGLVWLLLVLPSIAALWGHLPAWLLLPAVGPLGAAVTSMGLWELATGAEKRLRQRVKDITAEGESTHDWRTCICSLCGRRRDKNHQWEHCKCSICGQPRDRDHLWEHCKCTLCHKVRDQGHQFGPAPASPSVLGSIAKCTCRICGKISHDWDGDVCRRCRKQRVTTIPREAARKPSKSGPKNGAAETLENGERKSSAEELLFTMLLGAGARATGTSVRDLGVQQLSGMCDFCQTLCTGEVFTASQIARAANNGFCPKAARSMGLSARAWRRHATTGPASETDWLVCDSCVRELRPYL